jgi:hypothetical protein
MRKSCSRILTGVPSRRNSTLGVSTSKTPKRQVWFVLTGAATFPPAWGLRAEV